MIHRVGIIGGGLAGVYAAWALEQAGVDCVLLEARERCGGRLLTTSARTEHGSAGAFDLGATWYWPALQPEVGRLVDALGLRSFSQFDDGDLVFEQQPGVVRRFRGFDPSPPSMRLAGGMGALVQTLQDRVGPERLHLGHRVTSLAASESAVVIDAQDAAGGRHVFEVGHVLLAVPPRLAVATMRFEAALPAGDRSDWAACATWMAPHAKYLAVYPAPFWRRQGLCGGARSRSGPLVEVHDASGPEGPGALFGFVGVPAVQRARLSEASLRAMCRAQLGRLFGAEAAAPLEDWLQDWSREPFTATDADLVATGEHMPAAVQVRDGPWAGRLTGIASEWSTEFPGYVAGALDAARVGVDRAVDSLRSDGTRPSDASA